MKDRPEPRRITKTDGNAREDGRIYIRTVAREHRRETPKVNASAPSELNNALVFRPFRHRRRHAWHVSDFAAPATARAIDFDANFARLAAADCLENNQGGRR